jgi:predicted MFS family arabinose efflux permease
MTTAAPASLRSRTFAIVLAGFAAFVTLYAPQPLLPMLGAAFQIPAREISLIMTASALGVTLAAPFIGIVADRIGRKRVIVPCAFLLAIPTLFVGLSNGLDALLFWRFVQGILTPGIFAITIAYINDEWRVGAGRPMSAYVAGTVLGGFSGRMIAAFIAPVSSWRWAFAVLALIEALCGLGLLIWLPADRRLHVRSRTQWPRHTPQLLATYGVGFCVLFTLLATFTYVNFYLAEPPFHLSTQALGSLFLVYLIGAVVTTFAGRFIDTAGHRLTLAVSFAAGIAGMLLTLVPNLIAVIIGLALCCSGVFIAQSAATSYIGVIASQARAAAVGLYATSYYAGGSLGSFLPGRLWSFGGWPACVILVASAQAITIAAALLFWKPSPYPTSASPSVPAA